MASNDIGNSEKSDSPPRSSLTVEDPELSVSRIALRDPDFDVHQGSSLRPSLLNCQAGCFTGELAGENVFDFMRDVELYIHVNHMNPEETLKQLPLLLDGMAAEWWRCFRPHLNTWDEASKELIHHFGRINQCKVKNVSGKHKKKSKSHTSSFSHTDDEYQWDLTKCPKQFHGTSDEDVEAFIDDLELFIDVQMIPLGEAFLLLQLLLKGDAARWWKTIHDSVKTWEEAKTNLIRRFGYHQTSYYLLFNDLVNRRQQPNERALDYVISINSIMRKMNLSDWLQVSFTILGLKPSLAQQVIGKEKLGLLELTNEIIEIEADHKSISKKK